MSEYSAMTVNERLFVSGLMGEWDRAVQREDREKLTELLGRWNLRIKQQPSSTRFWIERRKHALGLNADFRVLSG